MASDTKPLNTYVSLASGNTPSKSNPDYWGGAVPWVSAKDMGEFWLEDSEDHLTQAGAMKASRLVPAGTVLMLTRGMTLHNRVPICRVARDVAFNQDVKAVLPKGGLSRRFLPYLLVGNHGRLHERVDAAGHGTGRLNTDAILSLPVYVPEIVQQEQIADLGESLDERIHNLRRANATLEAIAQSLFKSWFVDFDPVRAKAEGRELGGMDAATAALFPKTFVDSELGLIPKDWRVLALGDVLTERSERVGNRDIPEYSSTNSGLQPRSTQFRKELSASNSKNKVVREGELVFGLSRKVLNFGLMFEPVGCVSPVYRVFSVNQQVPPRFLERLMRINAEYFYGAVSASSREGQSVSSNGLSRLKFVRPECKVLDRFSDVTSKLSSRIATGDAQIRALVGIRETLLPRLISGKLRLPEARSAIEEVLA